jgi:hypothetical protein
VEEVSEGAEDVATPDALRVVERLQDEEVEVFYDKNEQHRILAEDVAEYLAPIYQSESQFIICLMGVEYPRRIWTKFESDQFRGRLGAGVVIPVWIDTGPGAFDAARDIGAHFIDSTGNATEQVQELVRLLIRKLRESRVNDRSVVHSACRASSAALKMMRHECVSNIQCPVADAR